MRGANAEPRGALRIPLLASMIPIKSSGRMGSLKEAEMATQARPGEGATVLVADGDPVLRGLLATLLRREGWIVSEAHDGAELVELVQAAVVEDGVPFDLIVTEVDMPGAGGLEALLGLGAMLARTRIIFTATRVDPTTEHVARSLGALVVLLKPFAIETLLHLATGAPTGTEAVAEAAASPRRPSS